MNRIKLHTKRPNIVCGWGSAPDPAVGASDAPPDLLVGWGWDIPPHFSALNAFDRCSWTFVGTGRKDGHPQFLKHGCALDAETTEKATTNPGNVHIPVYAVTCNIHC